MTTAGVLALVGQARVTRRPRRQTTRVLTTPGPSPHPFGFHLAAPWSGQPRNSESLSELPAVHRPLPLPHLLHSLLPSAPKTNAWDTCDCVCVRNKNGYDEYERFVLRCQPFDDGVGRCAGSTTMSNASSLGHVTPEGQALGQARASQARRHLVIRPARI